MDSRPSGIFATQMVESLETRRRRFPVPEPGPNNIKEYGGKSFTFFTEKEVAA